MKENKTKLVGIFLEPKDYEWYREWCFKNNIKMAHKARSLLLAFKEVEQAKMAEQMMEKSEDDIYDEVFNHPKVEFNPPEI